MLTGQLKGSTATWLFMPRCATERTSSQQIQMSSINIAIIIIIQSKNFSSARPLQGPDTNQPAQPAISVATSLASSL
jgi:hypothetical protein